MKLKVCGMREPDNIAALSALQPDYMGFIFWAPSSRYVSEDDTRFRQKHQKNRGFCGCISGLYSKQY